MPISRGESSGVEDPIERASIDEIRRLQLERLRWSLRHAYENVEHYRRSFDACEVHPDTLRSLDDLSKFPFLTKHDFRTHYPYGLFAVPHEKVVRLHASSGTTGKPSIAGYTAKDIDTWAGLMARSIRAAGARTGDIVHVAYGYGLFTGGLGAHYGAERLGCTVVPVSTGRKEWQVRLIQDLRPDILMATPSYALTLAEAFVRQGLDPRESSLRIGIFGAEPWTEAMRGELESRLGLSAVDIYGLSEVMGPGVACECLESRDGPVIWEDHFYPEVIDPETGRPLPEGEEGELVLTSLTREALPVIRYRTRDLTRLLPPTARSMRRLARVQARTDDMLIIRGVNVFPSQIEEQILRTPALAPHYQLELTREGYLDALTVHVESLGADDNASTRHKTASDLAGHLKTTIGIQVIVEVHSPGAIERSRGKARRLIDRRPVK